MSNILKIALLQTGLSRSDGQGNFRAIDTLIRRHQRLLRKSDICVLPECWFRSLKPETYEEACRKIQRIVGGALIAGSHHGLYGGKLYNRGIVLNREGRMAGRYGKSRPFDSEVRKKVRPYREICEFEIQGFKIAVMICADFFFSSTFERLKFQPDLIVVPAESVASSKNDPQYGRALWKHAAISRAYEFGSFVAVCDWARSTMARTCAATGFVDPTTQDSDAFFQSLGLKEGVLLATCDLRRLRRHRETRRSKNFFWR